MPIEFARPIYLLLLPAAGFIWWVGRRSLADLSRLRRRLAIGLRVLLLLLIIGALAGARLVRSSRTLCTVFLLDVSDSIPQELRQAGLRYAEEAAKGMKRGDSAALIVFGGEASLELAPCAALRIKRIYSNPDRTRTDISAALRLAMAAFPPRTTKQMVLLSDGNENLGAALEQALAASSARVRLHTVPLRAELKNEALLERASAPSEAKIGEPFELKVVARTRSPIKARLRLLRNGKPGGERLASLAPGRNVITFPQTIGEAGFYSYRVLLEPERDTISENNTVLSFTRVRGKPRLLYVEGQGQLGAPLERALASHDIQVERRGLAGLPTTLAECNHYDALLFSEVPALALHPDQMKLVQAAVRDLGVGFGMLGGEEGFGAGGYFGTAIEETLPVDTSVRKQKVMPSLAVMLILDISGSAGMIEDGVPKIKLEAEAAISVVELLQKIDQVGVIVSGEGVNVLAPVRAASSKGPVISALAGLEPGGGGIYCQPSLQRAYELMRPVKVRVKHIIMLADGTDCDEQGGCREIAAAMRAAKMTLSTVSFGLGPDTAFLEEVARLGGGNFYLANRARDLPRIFTKDTMLMSKSLFVEEPFRPRVAPGEEVTRGIDWETAPPLLGYVATSPKPVASVPLRSHKDDPVLATWRYGLGRSIAFTSDAKARWGAHWLGWRGYGQFWPQVIRWMLRQGTESRLQTLVEIDRGKGQIAVDALDPQQGFLNFLELGATVVTPSLRRVKLRLDQTGPGRYEASFEAREIGAYLVTVSQRKKGRWEAAQTSGAVVSYSPEYGDLKPNDYLLATLARTTGGEVGPPAERVLRQARRGARFPQDIWQILVLAAALLLPFDVAVRRLMLDWRQIQGAFGWTRDLRRGRRGLVRPPAPAAHPTLGRLLAGKAARGEGKADQTAALDPARVLREAEAEPAPPPPPEAAEAAGAESYTSRLLEAKRRAREAGREE
jgi:uncharacterized membrane protein